MLEIVRTKVGEDGFELRGIGAFWDRSLDEIVDAVAQKGAHFRHTPLRQSVYAESVVHRSVKVGQGVEQCSVEVEYEG